VYLGARSTFSPPFKMVLIFESGGSARSQSLLVQQVERVTFAFAPKILAAFKQMSSHRRIIHNALTLRLFADDALIF
jgi:hypothetical protein